jgi:hypothetical protein
MLWSTFDSKTDVTAAGPESLTHTLQSVPFGQRFIRRETQLVLIAPTESEPPFHQTQLLLLFILPAIIALRRFRLNPIATA